MAQHRLVFPETYVSPDGAEFSVRPARPDDREAFRAFFEKLPPRDRLHFQEDLTAPGALDRWANAVEAGRATILLALHDDRIVAQVGVLRRPYGWTRHVGYMQTIVLPEYRGRGIATKLVRRSIELAVQLGLDKVVAEVLTDQRRERKILEAHGFKKEAILQDHATDHEGRKRNVIVLSNQVYELWRRMEDLIIDKEFEVIP